MPSDQQPIYLAFHKLQNNCSFGVTNFVPKRLFRLLEYLQRTGWHLEATVPAASSTRRLVLTFDDAYAHLADILPRLIDRFGIQPVVFVPTGWIGKPNSWDYSHRLAPAFHMSVEQIRQLHGQGVQFGTHGQMHTDLTRLQPEPLARELEQSKSRLEEIILAPVTKISFPFGRVNQTVEDACRLAGYDLGFSMAFPSSQDRPLAQGRIPIYSFDTRLSIELKLCEGPGKRLERAKAVAVNKLSGGTTWLNRLRHPVD